MIVPSDTPTVLISKFVVHEIAFFQIEFSASLHLNYIHIKLNKTGLDARLNNISSNASVSVNNILLERNDDVEN